jgi:5'-nucleotidase
VKIHLLHTNDIHSQIENHLRAGAQLRAMRSNLEEQGDCVLTFDLGDVLDRVRQETEATYGRVNASLLGALSVDGWVFGNNEGLTIPLEYWADLSADSKTTVFGTNVRQGDGSPFPFFTDTKVFDCNGVLVGVFGLTPNYKGPYGMLGIQVDDPFVTAAHAVDLLVSQDCHIIVCLSHLGLFNDYKLAERVPGIDVILGGHTHQFMKQADYVGQTAIFQPGKHGLAFGHTVIEYDRNLNRVVRTVSEPIEVHVHLPYDEKMYQAYKNQLPLVRERLQSKIATLQEALPVQFNEESVFANLLVDSIFALYPGDLGIMMSGALTASLLAGDVCLEDVHGACPTPTRPVVMSLLGADILCIIEKGITKEYYNRRGLGFGFRGAVVGYLSLANAEVELADEHGQKRVESVRVGGELIDKKRTYRVVTCEYLWLAPVFDEFKNGSDMVFGRPLVREILLDSLSNPQIMERAHRKRYLLDSSRVGFEQ